MTKLSGVKNAIMQVIYLLNGSIFDLLFYCHIILYREKVTSYEKFSHNCLEDFSASILLLKVSKYWKIVELRKISINLKNCETFYETQTASRFKEIIQPLPTPYTTRQNLPTSL